MDDIINSPNAAERMEFELFDRLAHQVEIRGGRLTDTTDEDGDGDGDRDRDRDGNGAET